MVNTHSWFQQEKADSNVKANSEFQSKKAYKQKVLQSNNLSKWVFTLYSIQAHTQVS
uniref:Uncharacterized protein n=1 Tax=Rhizophora mucronata TaxID=61149 RepID=A0A2P2J4P5_RHIMU